MLSPTLKSKTKSDHGFTLIELLVVMIIIGILAAVAIPVYLNQQKKAADTAVKSDMVNVAQQLETNLADTQTYPSPTSWTDVTNSSVLGTTVKLSQNVKIEYAAASLSGVAGFCLAGSNPKSDADGTTYHYWYNSLDGGLYPSYSSSPAANKGCP